MIIKVNFEENDKKLDAALQDNGQTFEAAVGETTMIHAGQNGATFTPSVSEDGVISWTNDRELENPEPVNIKGADGKDGKDGVDGYTPIKGVDYFDGKDGVNGKDGADGYTPIKGKDYFDGVNGKDGKDGVDGKNGIDGKDGYTPQKGTDYWTPADKAEMVNDVISALPKYNGEVVSV